MNDQLSTTQTPDLEAAPQPEQRTTRDTTTQPGTVQASPPLRDHSKSNLRAWWRSRWLVYALLLMIVLVGGYFRTLRLSDWDGGMLLHPDERFFTDVTTLVYVPSSVSNYFDAALSSGNPRNVGKSFFVYGTFPVLLTRYVATTLTPAEALPRTVPNVSQQPDPDGDGQIANPELDLPRAEWLIELLNPEGNNLTAYGEVQVVGRSLVVLFDLGSIVLIYLIGSRVYDRRVGLLAAMLAALAVMSIQQSHFYVDPIFSTFFTLLTLYWAVRVAEGGGIWSYLAVGASIGLAGASRVTLVALGAVAIVAAVVGALRRYRAARQPTEATSAAAMPVDKMDGDEPAVQKQLGLFDHLIVRTLPLLVVAGVMSLLVFRIAHPYAFVGSTPESPDLVAMHGGSTTLSFMQGWGFFDVRPSPRFLDNMATIQRSVTGQDDFFPSQQWVNRLDYFFPWSNMVLWGMGPALGLVAWLAWAVVGWRLLRRIPAVVRAHSEPQTLVPLVLWFWVTLYFFWQGGQFVSTMRYMLPIYGPLIIFAAWLLVRLWQWARSVSTGSEQQVRLQGRGRWLWRGARLASRWALVTVLLLTLAWAYAFTRIYTRDHSRIQAAHWVAEHVPPGSRIAREEWDDPLPLQVTGTHLYGSVYQGVDTFPYADDNPREIFGEGDHYGLIDRLEEADYITLTSNRVYDSTKRLPMRYPVTMRYYHYLFNGELGFELVADIPSYPTLFGVSIPDQSAEEAFSVYDHPRVLIFEKTPLFSRERAEALLTEGANWGEIYRTPVGVADKVPTALRLTTEEWRTYAAGGTWSAMWDASELINHDLVAPLLWLVVLELIGLAAFALLFRLMPWLPDRGWSLARVLGLLVIAYLAWMLGSLSLLAFTPLTVWLCTVPLLVAGAWVAWTSRVELQLFVRQRWRALATAEVIYLVAFVALVLIRWFNPDLWHPARGGEKPMDFAYLNAVLQSASFPAYDPWFAGGYINYYYFGFVIVGALVHLTGIVPAVAYNLAVPTICALTALGAWGVIYNLLAPRPQALARQAKAVQRSERRAGLAALLAPLFVVVVGNLAQAYWFLSGYAEQNAYRAEWAFWDATRIIPMTVNEFPFFTFLFADLHAHMIVLPFSLAVVGLLVALARRASVPRLASAEGWTFWVVLGLLGLLAGTLRATNTWDYPTFVGLTIATLALLAWWQFQRGRRGLTIKEAVQRERELWLLAGRQVLLLIGQMALVVGLGNLLFWPFISRFATDAGGVQLFTEGLAQGMVAQILEAPRTTLTELLLINGLWLFLVVSAGIVLLVRNTELRRRPMVTPWLLGLLIMGGSGGLWLLTSLASLDFLDPRAPALLVPLLVGAAVLAWLVRNQAPRKLLPLLWAGTALALCTGVEFFVVTGDIGRMNAVFKFGLHAWVLFGLAAAVATPWVWRNVFRTQRGGTSSVQATPVVQTGGRVLAGFWRAVVLVLVGASLVYPVTATPARIADRIAPDLPHTLDGTAYMQMAQTSENGQMFDLGEDLAAIAWLQQNVQGTPIVLEAHLPAYRWGSRVSIHTGLPTLLGWEWHQIQQRMVAQGDSVLRARQDTIRQIYDGEAAQALELLRLYGIEYVYVGGLERALFTPAGLAKFEQLAQQGELQEVYRSENGLTRIYQVVAVGEPTVLTSALPVVPPTMEMTPPLLLDEPVSELPIVADYAWNTWASGNDWAALLLWGAALYGLLLLGLPLAVLLFGTWRDGGVVWARLLGLLLLGYAVWLPTSLGLWHYDWLGVLCGLLLVLFANVGLLSWIGYTQGAGWLWKHLKQHRGAILISEGLFVVGFLALVVVRALNPDLWHPVWGGEKPMEFGFLNAILRSAVMPPYDPFFSDGYINYYYYGIYLVSLPIRVTGIDPAIAYNLVVPTVFALTLAAGYAIVAQLTRSVRYGLLGAVFLVLVGNLASVLPYGWARGIQPVVDHLSANGLAGVGTLGVALGDWYVGPTRVVDFTINEFPFFTFVFADLHPHMIALPIVLLVVALAYQYVRGMTQGGQPLRLWAVVTTLGLGTLAVTNSWDFPTYTLLVGAVLVGVAWRSQSSGVPWLALVRAALLAVGLAVAGLALYMPFFDRFHAMVSGVGLVRDTTNVVGYLLLYGLFLFVILPVVFGILWRLLQICERRQGAKRRTPLVLLVCVVLPVILVLAALLYPQNALSLWLAVLFVLGVGLFLERRLNTMVWFVLLLALVAWAVSLGVEILFIRDHLVADEFYRMNTVFKFGLQVWTLLALAAAASLPLFLRGLQWFGRQLRIDPAIPQVAGGAAVVALVAAAALFPLVGTPNRVANRFDITIEPTLDGLAFLETARFTYDCSVFGGCEPGSGMVEIDLTPEAAAIAWLEDHLTQNVHELGTGTPVVVQSDLWFYRGYGIRVAANTGFPTVISGLHVNEQRDPMAAARRSLDVGTFYRTTDTETTLRILAKYDVDYIYIGSVERAIYPAAGLQKFAAMEGTYLTRLYGQDGIEIYEVAIVPPDFAQPQPVVFEPFVPSRLRDGATAGELAPVTETAEQQSTEPGLDISPEEQNLALLEEQVALYPTDAGLAYSLAIRYRELNRLGAAAGVLEVAAAANLMDVGLHHLWGDILAQAGRHDEAEQVYREIAERAPAAGNWNKLAVALYERGDLEAAEAALERALELDASAPEPYFRRGQVAFRQGDREQAIISFEQYLALEPEGYFAGEAQRLLEDLR